MIVCLTCTNCPFHPSTDVLVCLFCTTYLPHKRFCTYRESITALRGNLPPAPQPPMTQLDNNLRQLCRFSAGGPLVPLIVLHMLYTLHPKGSSIMYQTDTKQIHRMIGSQVRFKCLEMLQIRRTLFLVVI